jgi:hypothetical protein
MNFSDIIFSEGDTVFLFSKLDIEESLLHKLPFEIFPGIHLAPTPNRELVENTNPNISEKDHISLVSWIYPGYTLGMNECDVCIKIDKSVPKEIRENYFWRFATALLLAKPLYIKVEGSFVYGNEKNGFLGERLDMHMLGYRSNISLNSVYKYANEKFKLQYDEEDFKLAKMYFLRILEVVEQKDPRPFNVLKTFSEAMFWEKLNYRSTIFSKLIPLIDSFSGNPNREHEKKVSERLSMFLQEIPSKLLEKPLTRDYIKGRIANIWRLHRSPNLHGHEKDTPPVNSLATDGATSDSLATNAKDDLLELKEVTDLFDLMEISRLAITKMLLLDAKSYQYYCAIPNSRPDNHNERNESSKQFFEGAYPNSSNLFTYIDVSSKTR